MSKPPELLLSTLDVSADSYVSFLNLKVLHESQIFSTIVRATEVLTNEGREELGGWLHIYVI
jgi:hypothetical protein